jgi:hypothetical protein
MPQGPLIPGLEEFDVPRRGFPAWLGWTLAGLAVLIAIIVASGLFAGTGPLRALGLTTQELVPVAYRPTADPRAIQIAVALPPQGLCRSDNVVGIALEQSNRIEVSTSVTRSRNVNCQGVGVAGDRVWVDVPLRFTLGERSIIRSGDRQPLPRDS